MQTIRVALGLFTLLALGCSPKAIPPNEAREAVNYLEVIGKGTQDPDTRIRMLYSTCGELPSCAGECKRALMSCGDGSLDPSMRGAILADCFSDLKKEHAANGIQGEAWFRRYFSKYLDRARGALQPELQNRLDKIRGQLQLNEG